MTTYILGSETSLHLANLYLWCRYLKHHFLDESDLLNLQNVLEGHD